MTIRIKKSKTTPQAHSLDIVLKPPTTDCLICGTEKMTRAIYIRWGASATSCSGDGYYCALCVRRLYRLLYPIASKC